MSLIVVSRNNHGLYSRLKYDTTLCIARLLFDYRAATGLSQSDVARRTAGLGPRTISTLETGRRTDRITLAQLLALLKVYKVSLAEFERDLCTALMESRRGVRRSA